MLMVQGISQPQDCSELRNHQPVFRRHRFVWLVLYLRRGLPMIPRNVGDQIHLKLGQSDQGTGLNEIESVLVVIGNVHIVADIVQQGSDFQNQSRLGIQFMKRRRLSKNLQRESGDRGRMFLVEKIFLAHASRRLDHLFAVNVFFSIPELGQQFQQNAVLQTNSGNDNFIDTRLLHDLVENNRRGNNDICPVGTETQIMYPVLHTRCPKFFEQTFPPPMSISSATLFLRLTVAFAARWISRASSSPPMIEISIPLALFTAFSTASRFIASRSAHVPTAFVCVTACSSNFCLNSVNVSTVLSMVCADMAPFVNTSCPRRTGARTL